MDRAKAFGFVHFPVAKEGPNLAVGLFDQAAVLHVFHEARLVDRHQRAKAHGYRRELPVVRHQPRVRVRRQTAARDFGTEVFKLFLTDAAFHKGTRVDAGHNVALEEHQIATMDRRFGPPEVVQTHIIHRRGRRERSDVAAVFGRHLVPLDHCCHRVPAVDRTDAPFHFDVARHVDFVIRRDRVLIRCCRRERQIRACCACLLYCFIQKKMRAVGSVALDDVLDRFHPLLGFDRVDVVLAVCHWPSSLFGERFAI